MQKLLTINGVCYIIKNTRCKTFILKHQFYKRSVYNAAESKIHKRGNNHRRP